MVDDFELGRQKAKLSLLRRSRNDDYMMNIPEGSSTGECGCETCAKKNKKKKRRQPTEVQKVQNA